MVAGDSTEVSVSDGNISRNYPTSLLCDKTFGAKFG